MVAATAICVVRLRLACSLLVSVVMRVAVLVRGLAGLPWVATGKHIIRTGPRGITCYWLSKRIEANEEKHAYLKHKIIQWHIYITQTLSRLPSAHFRGCQEHHGSGFINYFVSSTLKIF